MRVDESVVHLLAECPAYYVDRDCFCLSPTHPTPGIEPGSEVIRQYKGILGKDKLELKEKGLSFLRAIVEDVPLQLVEITKTFIMSGMVENGIINND